MARLGRVGVPMKHAAPGSARVQGGRREGGRRRASGGLGRRGSRGSSAMSAERGSAERGFRGSSPGSAERGFRGSSPGSARQGSDRSPAGAAQPDVTRWEQLPYWLIVTGMCAALGIIRLGTHQLKSGTLVLAGVLLAAAIARLVLPDRRAGMLSSRRRWLDVAVFAVLGIGLLIAGLGVQAIAG